MSSKAVINSETALTCDCDGIFLFDRAKSLGGKSNSIILMSIIKFLFKIHSKKPFYAKNKKEPFWHKIGYYSLIYYIILKHFEVVIKLLLIKLLISHFNHADFWRRKTAMALFV